MRLIPDQDSACQPRRLVDDDETEDDPLYLDAPATDAHARTADEIAAFWRTVGVASRGLRPDKIRWRAGPTYAERKVTVERTPRPLPPGTI